MMLNVKQLIKQLQTLDPDTILYMTNHDIESGTYWIATVGSVSEDGYIEDDFVNEHPDSKRILKEWNADQSSALVLADLPGWRGYWPCGN